jgi:hypothetical protein
MTRMRGSSEPAGGARVPVEFIGLARAFRGRINCKPPVDLLRRVRPRPGFQPMPRHDYLRRLVADWRALHDPGRLALLADFADGMHLAELRISPTRMRFAGWHDEGTEAALSIGLHLVTCKPPKFREERAIVADVGLHALARRFQRASDHADAAVLADLAALAPKWRDTAGEFRIPAPSGGHWIGSVTAVRGAPVLAVRTFV